MSEGCLIYDGSSPARDQSNIFVAPGVEFTTDRCPGWVVTSEMSFHLFQPVKKTDLLARGRILKSGGRQDIADMRCWDQDNNLVAHATGTYIYLGNVPIKDLPKP